MVLSENQKTAFCEQLQNLKIVIVFRNLPIRLVDVIKTKSMQVETDCKFLFDIKNGTFQSTVDMTNEMIDWIKTQPALSNNTFKIARAIKQRLYEIACLGDNFYKYAFEYNICINKINCFRKADTGADIVSEIESILLDFVNGYALFYDYSESEPTVYEPFNSVCGSFTKLSDQYANS